MATSKRERQKAARRQKLEAQQRAAKRRKNTRLVVIVAIVALLVLGSGVFLFAGHSTTTTTIEGPTSQTDIDAEAAQEAKQADPAGYYAANYASWGSQLSKMLYGTPLTNMETTADTFTGPVGSDTALTGASGTSTTTTPAPATTAA